MRPRMRCWTAVAAACAAGGAARAEVAIMALAADGPPLLVPAGAAMGEPISYAGPDDRAAPEMVVDLAVTDTCRMFFGIPVMHMVVGGDEWPEWGHGFAGDVYSTDLRAAMLLTPESPRGVDYLGFYARPAPFGTFSVVVQGLDGMGGTSLLEQLVTDVTGAMGWGVYAGEGMRVQGVLVTSDVGFAVAEIGVHEIVPGPSAWMALAGAGVGGRRRRA